jgi:NAD(P)H-dependent FMN reductase
MKDEPLKIAVLAGTTRVQRHSIHAARFVAEVGRSIDGVEIRFADPKDFNLPGDGNDPEGKDPKYSELTAWAEAFFIVTPEYNHGYPGSLKRMLDSELQNYIHKPVALAGVSDGNWGGVRVVEALVNTVREMGLIVTFTDAYFPRVKELFNEAGEIQDSAVEGRVRKSYAELIWMAKVLKHGRDTLPRAI